MGEENRAGQIRSLMAVDELVDGLMKTLGSLHERKRTLAFYLSDNGHQWSEHALTDKRYPYTESIMVPLLMRWPGHVAAGATDTRGASNVDLAPTILQAAGVSQTGMDGRSLLMPWSRPRPFLENFPDRNTPEIPAWASIRTDSLQYVEYYEPDGLTIAFREYYDLTADPYQLENVLGDRNPANDPPPEELALLSAEIANGRACRGTSGPSACP
jgi:arylsulfatase A-like enzyme